ncbi:MAG TPA: hypothetical protein DDZ83_03865 [Nitrospinae bacterium]|nr:hypothetical protein [Nitrospinota bacterium]
MEKGEIDEAIGAFHRALEIDPKYAEAYNSLGAALSDKGELKKALKSFRRALEIDLDLPETQNNIRNTLGQQIPEWHFFMLADSVRNKAYLSAIQKAVDASSRVLDIGTGTGLLALIAARAGAAEVVAFEISKPIAEAAQQIVRDNGYLDKITVINKKSTQLILGSDIREPANLLIFEIFDAGLLGEGLLPSLRHAFRNLVTPDVRLIPQAASIYGMLIETSRLRTVNPVSSICGFDFSAFDRFRNPHDYGSFQLKHEEHKRLTDPFFVKKFEFDKIPVPIPHANPHKMTLEKPVIEDGAVHAIAFWFDLHLDDDTTISNGPEGELIHWGQAVQFFEGDKQVQKGERVRFTMTYSDHQILFIL